MPILGVIASSISGNLYSNSFESIQTVTVGAGGVSSIDFTSIPSTYQHLQIRYIAKSTNAATAADNLGLRFNSDTGSNYTRHYLDGSGTTVTSGNNTSVTQVYATCGQSSATYTNVFGGGIIDILDYANTSKYKTSRAMSGVEFTAAGGAIQYTSGLWMSTSAISSINIRALSGNLAQYSTFALYGIKAS